MALAVLHFVSWAVEAHLLAPSEEQGQEIEEETREATKKGKTIGTGEKTSPEDVGYRTERRTTMATVEEAQRRRQKESGKLGDRDDKTIQNDEDSKADVFSKGFKDLNQS